MAKSLDEINNDIEISTLKSLTFSLLRDETIEKLSHVIVTKPQPFINDQPVDYGIYDIRMGSTSNEYQCGTCGFPKHNCLGHSGHMILKYPVIKPMFINALKKFLKIFCSCCASFVMGKKQAYDLIDSMGSYSTAEAITVQLINNRPSDNKCVECGETIIKTVKTGDKELFINYYTTNPDEKRPFLTHLLEDLLKRILPEDIEKMKLKSHQHPKHYINNFLYVPSNQIRPDAKQIGIDKIANDQITSYLQIIFKTNDSIVPVASDAKEIASDNFDKIRYMNMFIYALLIGNTVYQRSIVDFKPIMDRLRGKDGIIRHNILGRRIHGMARAVIVCDPTLPQDTIRIPILFAKTIQITETVNDFNKPYLMRYVRNGVDGYPGSTKVFKKRTQRTYAVFLAKNLVLEDGDIVYRDLIDGDWIYFNRQPSLLYSSLIAMKVIIDEDPNCHVISKNVLICNFFNSDRPPPSLSETDAHHTGYHLTCVGKWCKGDCCEN